MPPVKRAVRIRKAQEIAHPIVALESTVISHGLPYPHNYNVARACESVIHDEGVVSATVGIIAGELRVGLSDDDIHQLATRDDVRKVSRRDFGITAARGTYGATTVAGTMIAAHLAGIRVFATGGIGGVHRGDSGDVSADLTELGRTPVVVVCAGAKSILDLPRTLEYLETLGVPVLGFQTDTFPAFYATSSGLPVDARVDTLQEAAAIILAHWSFNLQSGILLTVPPPAELALPVDEMEAATHQALDRAQAQGVTGKALTPFLLEQVSSLTAGKSLEVNIALLKNNARIAARLAGVLSQKEGYLQAEKPPRVTP
jgi:pseudouridine-5'-phosphate glycosidase